MRRASQKRSPTCTWGNRFGLSCSTLGKHFCRGPQSRQVEACGHAAESRQGKQFGRVVSWSPPVGLCVVSWSWRSLRVLEVFLCSPRRILVAAVVLDVAFCWGGHGGRGRHRREVPCGDLALFVVPHWHRAHKRAKHTFRCTYTPHTCLQRSMPFHTIAYHIILYHIGT